MIETLTNIKNNKVKNLPGGQGQVASETTTKMKKFLGGLSRKRQGKRFDLYFVDLRLILIIALLHCSHGARTPPRHVERHFDGVHER